MRGRFALVSLVLLGAIGALAYSNATRPPATPTSSDGLASAESAAPEIVTPSFVTTDPGDMTEAAERMPTSETASVSVEKWIADSLNEDRDKRSAAIIALARAPRAQAVPALREVLEVGDAEPDRQLALRSLHTLAIEQGDDDGIVRDTLRRVMYHGDDDGVTQSAQAYLEDIEAAMEEDSPSPRPSP